MKTKVLNQYKFSPVTLILTFENQKELDVITSLFNYTPVCDVLRSVKLDPKPTREKLREAGGNTSAFLDEFRKSFRIYN